MPEFSEEDIVSDQQNPHVREGSRIPRYRPASKNDCSNPWALAIWLGAFVVQEVLHPDYRIVGGRLWVVIQTAAGK